MKKQEISLYEIFNDYEIDDFFTRLEEIVGIDCDKFDVVLEVVNNE